MSHPDEPFDEFLFLFRADIEGVLRDKRHGRLFQQISCRFTLLISGDGPARRIRCILVDAASSERLTVYPYGMEFVIEGNDRSVREILVKGLLHRKLLVRPSVI